MNDFEKLQKDLKERFGYDISIIHTNQEQTSSSVGQKQIDEKVNKTTIQELKSISGTMTSERNIEIKTEIDLSSKNLKKIKNNKDLFNEEKLNPNSIIWLATASMLLELNNVDEDIALNKDIKYSDKINISYKNEFKRSLLDDSNEQARELRDFVDAPGFPEYYKYGYHDQKDINYDLFINKDFLNEFVNCIHRDQKSHGFDIQSNNIKESSNKYMSKYIDEEIRRTEPLIRKSGQTYSSTNDPDFDIQSIFNASKKHKTR